MMVYMLTSGDDAGPVFVPDTLAKLGNFAYKDTCLPVNAFVSSCPFRVK